MKVKLDDWNKFQSNLECTICILAFFCVCVFRDFLKRQDKNKLESLKKQQNRTTFHNTFILNYGEFQFNTYFFNFNLFWFMVD